MSRETKMAGRIPHGQCIYTIKPSCSCTLLVLTAREFLPAADVSMKWPGRCAETASHDVESPYSFTCSQWSVYPRDEIGHAFPRFLLSSQVLGGESHSTLLPLPDH